MKISRKILFFSGLLFLQPAFAAHVLPEFAGFWYSVATPVNVDACTQQLYSYADKNSSNQQLADQILSKSQTPNNCTWGEAYQSQTTTTMPQEFIGNAKDWNAITSNTNSNITTTWKSDCKDQKGNITQSNTVQLKPGYQCPTGSRFSRNSDGTYGCSTTPTPCLADEVGRDLGVPLMGRFGHAAIIAQQDSPMVLEQLNGSGDAEGIHIDSLYSFMHQPNDLKFWGEKYGLKDKPYLTLDEADKIIQTGKDQMQYAQEYTFLWGWHSGSLTAGKVFKNGKWKNVKTATSAKFRCDTFIYYDYLIGINLSIVDKYHFPYSPLTVYNKFTTERTPVSLAPAAWRKNFSEFISYQNPITTANVENQITKIFSQKKLSVEKADKATYNYLQEQHNLRTEKINFLWKLAQQYQDNEIKFGYLLDALALQTPVEIAPEMIQNFNSQTDTANKLKLLSTLAAAANMPLQSKLATVMQNNADNVTQIQEFFTQTLQQSNNKEVLHRTLMLYPGVVGPENAYQVYTNFQNDNFKNIKQILSEHEYNMQVISTALSTQETQQNILPDILSNTNKQTNDFNNSIYLLIKSTTPKDFSASAKTQLMTYIQSQKPDTQAETEGSANIEQSRSYYNWLNALATVSTNNLTQKYKFIAAKFSQIHNPALLGNLLFVADHRVLKSFSKTQLRSMQNKIQTSSQLNKTAAKNTIYSQAAALMISPDVS
jgi:hypothetical protein